MATKAQAMPLVRLEVRVNRLYKSGIAGAPLSGTELRLRSILRFFSLSLFPISLILFIYFFFLKKKKNYLNRSDFFCRYCRRSMYGWSNSANLCSAVVWLSVLPEKAFEQSKKGVGL